VVRIHSPRPNFPQRFISIQAQIDFRQKMPFRQCAQNCAYPVLPVRVPSPHERCVPADERITAWLKNRCDPRGTLRVAAVKTHSSDRPAARRIWIRATARGVNGITRRALAVFPNGMWSALSRICSHRNRRHSSGRSPQSMSRVGMPTSPFASDVLCAASICSATRLFVCFVLSRIASPFQVNRYHHTQPRL
jgi:hypothetical protein